LALGIKNPCLRTQLLAKNSANKQGEVVLVRAFRCIAIQVTKNPQSEVL
jgi:hypothetical protein